MFSPNAGKYKPEKSVFGLFSRSAFPTESLANDWLKSFLQPVFFNLELGQNEKILAKLSSNLGSFSDMIMLT